MYINELFYSLQGEGANVGRASIFVRFSGCNLRCAYCDTDFGSGNHVSVEDLYQQIKDFPARFIIWTGGEPTLQLTEEILAFFAEKGYTQAIETNGTNPVPKGLDYITCSPKPEAMDRLWTSFPEGVDEFRFPITAEGDLPPAISTLPPAKSYLVSPVFVGEDAMSLDPLSLQRCIDFVLERPEWRLSMQLHKLINIK